MRAGPQVFHLARAGDEGLHRADGQRKQRGLALRVGGKGTRKGAGQVQVVPDGVVGDTGIGRQQLPQLAELAVVAGIAQLGGEAPEGEQGFLPVLLLTGVLRFECQQQIGVVLKAARLDVVKVGVAQAAMLAQVELLARQRMDKHRLVSPAHLRPVGHSQGFFFALFGDDADFAQRPLGAVGSRSPPVGTLHMAVHGCWDAFFE